MTQTTASTTLTGDYDLDPVHSRIGFAAKHAMVATVRGHFTNCSRDPGRQRHDRQR
jgi:polyisoprenoid-binding protein YceI